MRQADRVDHLRAFEGFDQLDNGEVIVATGHVARMNDHFGHGVVVEEIQSAEEGGSTGDDAQVLRFVDDAVCR